MLLLPSHTMRRAGSAPKMPRQPLANVLIVTGRSAVIESAVFSPNLHLRISVVYISVWRSAVKCRPFASLILINRAAPFESAVTNNGIDSTRWLSCGNQVRCNDVAAGLFRIPMH